LLRPGTSEIVSWTQQMTNPVWLSHLGHVSGLTYSWAMPGGCDQMSATLAIAANVRYPALNPGRILQIYRGSHLTWEGTLTEPQPPGTGGTGGWSLSATGAGNYGTAYLAYYTGTWPSTLPDLAINNAITRGMRWMNPGQNGIPGLWLGAEVDPAGQTITDLLTLCCTYGGLTWYVTTNNYGNTLNITALPVKPTRLLTVSTPQGRSLGGDYNRIYEKYVITADNTTSGAAEVDGITASQNMASGLLYGNTETYIDLTQAGVMSAATAQGYGTAMLQQFVHASWAGPLPAGPGDLMTLGGQAVDLGTDQCGTVIQPVLTDYAYGGEVNMATPVSFLVGNYSYDDDTLTASITPFQALDTSLPNLLGAASATLPQSSAD
jgi:hypothetical protein